MSCNILHGHLSSVSLINIVVFRESLCTKEVIFSTAHKAGSLIAIWVPSATVLVNYTMILN